MLSRRVPLFTTAQEGSNVEMRKPSRTAVNTAVWRAVHTLLDDHPKILADPFARDLAGFDSDEALLAAHDAPL
jgi:O-methyltransferase involved in polyketide biosynthesis